MAEATTYLDAAYRALAWCGYAGLAGTLTLLLLLWPAGARQRRVALVALAGSGLLVLATAGWVLLRLTSPEGLPRVEGASALVRLAVLAGVSGFFTDLLDGPIRGRRRVAAAVVTLALTATMLTGSAGGVPGQAGASLTGDVYVALAALVLGGCTALAVVVRAGDARTQLPMLRARTGPLARPALGLTALAGAVHAIAVERSPLGVPGLVATLEAVLLLASVAAVLSTRRLLSVRGQGQVAAVSRVASTFPGAVHGADLDEVGPDAGSATPPAGRFEPPEASDVSEDLSTPSEPGPPPRVVVLPDSRAATGEDASSVRGRRPSTRAQRARYVAGLGRLVLPDPADAPTVRRTVRVAGSVEPLVVELPDTRVTSPGR